MAAQSPADAPAALSWPTIGSPQKPWAYWHWLGSAVDETNLVRELHRYAAAGLGGMHVIPIYGAKGWEDRAIPYLSPRWLELLGFTVTEAGRLGLGIDLTTGTGWNFGGPNITPELSCLRVDNRTFDLAAGERPATVTDRQAVLAVLAEAKDGRVIDLTDRVGPDGRLDWSADAGGWRLRVVRFTTGLPLVKRAAPGGAGPMLNPFYGASMARYLERFSDAFASYGGPRPRAMYHDSYEYAGASWSPDLLPEFQKRRGYRLEEHRDALFGSVTNEVARRVRGDYRATLADLLLEAAIRPWAGWARDRGFLTRNQAHGSPGNLLDLYAVADIPETEMFSKDRDLLVSQFASSAAHVTGRSCVAAETGTWVAEHFTETLADLKRNVDDLFLSGVNHVFYHGTCYSPDEAGWPGWLFYAATQFNPRNPIWHDAPALNAYVARCQSILQAGRPDNDLLVYWPIHDLWHDQEPLVQQLSVHQRQWLDGQRIGQLTRPLWQQGYAFDFVSDRQLTAARVVKGKLRLPGGDYAALLVPHCRHLPVETARGLAALAHDGATVIFDAALPEDVPGLANLETRRQELRRLLAPLRPPATPAGPVREVRLGRGRVVVGEALAALAKVGVRRETLVDQGALAFVRRVGESADYFLVNRSRQAVEGWVPLGCRARSVALLDPLSGRTGWGAVRNAGVGRTAVFLQLPPHASIIARAVAQRGSGGKPWVYVTPRAAAPTVLHGTWQVEFLEGGPELPAPVTTDRLGSWTELGGEASERFAGTARYTVTFDAPGPGRTFQLDLGGVAQSARVRFNGQDLGTLIMPPFRVVLADLNPKGNRLEVEVTSTAANRIRDLDRRGVKWKNFHDINFVSITYQPFDASKWPVHEDGLLGPVTLQAVDLEAIPPR